MTENNQQAQQVSIKIDDATLKGRYANAMQVSHTKEEFILDFINLFPPQGVVNARVVTSPGHVKRIIAALQENVGKYEAQNGKIQESPAPQDMSYTVN